MQINKIKNSQCIIISKDIEVLKKVKKLIKLNLAGLSRRKIAEKSLKTNGLLIRASDDKNVIDLINLIDLIWLVELTKLLN